MFISRDECVKCGWPPWLQKLLQDFCPGTLAIRNFLDQKDADSGSFIHSPCQVAKFPRVKAGCCPSFYVSTCMFEVSALQSPCFPQLFFLALAKALNHFAFQFLVCLNETVYCIYCGTRYSALILHLFQHMHFWLVFYDVVFLSPTCSVKVHLC